MTSASLVAVDRPRSILGSPAGELALLVRQGNGERELVRWRANRVTLGSAPEATFHIPDTNIRPIQCLILCGERGTVVRNFGPDTRLNGAPIVDALLSPRDQLQIGAWTFEVLSTAASTEADVAPPAETSTPPRQAARQPADLGDQAWDRLQLLLTQQQASFAREWDEWKRERLQWEQKLDRCLAQLSDIQEAVRASQQSPHGDDEGRPDAVHDRSDVVRSADTRAGESATAESAEPGPVNDRAETSRWGSEGHSTRSVGSNRKGGGAPLPTAATLSDSSAAGSADDAGFAIPEWLAKYNSGREQGADDEAATATGATAAAASDQASPRTAATPGEQLCRVPDPAAAAESDAAKSTECRFGPIWKSDPLSDCQVIRPANDRTAAEEEEDGHGVADFAEDADLAEPSGPATHVAEAPAKTPDDAGTARPSPWRLAQAGTQDVDPAMDEYLASLLRRVSGRPEPEASAAPVERRLPPKSPARVDEYPQEFADGETQESHAECPSVMPEASGPLRAAGDELAGETGRFPERGFAPEAQCYEDDLQGMRELAKLSANAAISDFDKRRSLRRALVHLLFLLIIFPCFAVLGRTMAAENELLANVAIGAGLFVTVVAGVQSVRMVIKSLV